MDGVGKGGDATRKPGGVGNDGLVGRTSLRLPAIVQIDVLVAEIRESGRYHRGRYFAHELLVDPIAPVEIPGVPSHLRRRSQWRYANNIATIAIDVGVGRGVRE